MCGAEIQVNQFLFLRNKMQKLCQQSVNEINEVDEAAYGSKEPAKQDTTKE